MVDDSAGCERLSLPSLRGEPRFSWGRSGNKRVGWSWRGQPVWRFGEEAVHHGRCVFAARGSGSSSCRRRKRARQAVPLAIGDAVAESRSQSVGDAAAIPLGDAVAIPSTNGDAAALADTSHGCGVRVGIDRVGPADVGSSDGAEPALADRGERGGSICDEPSTIGGAPRSANSIPWVIRSGDALGSARSDHRDEKSRSIPADPRARRVHRPPGGHVDLRAALLRLDRVSGLETVHCRLGAGLARREPSSNQAPPPKRPEKVRSRRNPKAPATSHRRS